MASSKEVTGCADCPFNYDWLHCLAPDSDDEEIIEVTESIMDYLSKEGSPYWCPLKKGEVIISIKK